MDAQMRAMADAFLACDRKRYDLGPIADEAYDYSDSTHFGYASAIKAVHANLDRAWIATHRAFIEDRIEIDDYEAEVERLLRRRQAAGLEPS